MKTLRLAFGASRETEIVSGWPGVTWPSETTRAFRKMNLICPFAERPFGVVPLARAAAGTSAHASAANNARAARLLLPSDTGGLSQDVAGSARRPAPRYVNTLCGICGQFQAHSGEIC